jgi:hypothetical protein
MALGLLHPLEYDLTSLSDILMEIGGDVRTFVTPYIVAFLLSSPFFVSITHGQLNRLDFSISHVYKLLTAFRSSAVVGSSPADFESNCNDSS